MKLNIKYKILALTFLLIGYIDAQDSFILNYEDVDIKKLPKTLLNSQKKQSF